MFSIFFGVELVEIMNRISKKIMATNIWLQELVSMSMKPTASYYRAVFLDSLYPSTKKLNKKNTIPNHTHEYSASLRRASIAFSKKFSRAIGKRMYMYQESPTDQMSGSEDGLSYHYWIKDVGAVPRFPDVTIDHVITMIDVDYYLDMPQIMSMYHGNTFLIYTFLPQPIVTGKLGTAPTSLIQ